jgi:hypothetical protein
LGQNRPDPEKKTGGDYFPPPILLLAERCSFCMQEEMKPKTKEMLDGKEELHVVEETVPCWPG